MASQYTCPVSLSSFLASAKPLVGELRPHGEGGPVIPIMLTPKEFSSHSYGWFLSAPGTMDVGGQVCRVQLSLNVVLTKSGERSTAPAAAGAA